MHNLIYVLIRNAKLTRKFCLRDARSVSSTDDDLPFAVVRVESGGTGRAFNCAKK